MVRRLVWEKFAGWQALLSNNLSQYKCHQILYVNARDPKFDSSIYLVLLFSFLVLTKYQVLKLRVGRPRDQVLQRTY